MTLDTVPLGRTGLSVSQFALGTWRFGRETEDGEPEVKRGRAFELLDAYAESGGNFLDTADVYGDGDAEDLIGDWLQSRDRESFVIASKVYFPTGDDPNARGLNRKHLRRQLAVTLDRLRTDYLDLLYVHRWDDATPAEGFMRTLDEFVADGRVHYLGASTREPNAWKVAKANEIARREGYEPFTVAQVPYSLVDRDVERNYLPMCEDYGLAVVPYSPLAGGFLTGKYERGAEPPAESRGAVDSHFADRYLRDGHFDVLETVETVADEVGATPAQVALAWLLANEDVAAPVVGARTVDQLRENLDAADVTLTDDQFDRLAGARP